MHELDRNILELREEKKVLQSLERLLVNPDFQKVILDDFLTKHPLSLLKGKGRLNLTPEANLDIDRQLECVALFQMYLETKTSQIADIDIKIHDAETLRDQETRNT